MSTYKYKWMKRERPKCKYVHIVNSEAEYSVVEQQAEKDSVGG